MLPVGDKQLFALPPVRVVLSNYARPDMKARCLALGAEAVFEKSREIDELLTWLADQKPPSFTDLTTRPLGKRRVYPWDLGSKPAVPDRKVALVIDCEFSNADCIRGGARVASDKYFARPLVRLFPTSWQKRSATLLLSIHRVKT